MRSLSPPRARSHVGKTDYVRHTDIVRNARYSLTSFWSDLKYVDVPSSRYNRPDAKWLGGLSEGVDIFVCKLTGSKGVLGSAILIGAHTSLGALTINSTWFTP